MSKEIQLREVFENGSGVDIYRAPETYGEDDTGRSGVLRVRQGHDMYSLTRGGEILHEEQDKKNIVTPGSIVYKFLLDEGTKASDDILARVNTTEFDPQVINEVGKKVQGLLLHETTVEFGRTIVSDNIPKLQNNAVQIGIAIDKKLLEQLGTLQDQIEKAKEQAITEREQLKKDLESMGVVFVSKGLHSWDVCLVTDEYHELNRRDDSRESTQ